MSRRLNPCRTCKPEDAGIGKFSSAIKRLSNLPAAGLHMWSDLMTPNTTTSNRGSTGRVAPVAWPPKLADLLHRRPDLADVALAPLDLGMWAA